MSEQLTLEQRVELGKALRKRAPRVSHSDVGNIQRDPIKLLEASSAGRVERLVPLRYGRMLASPFAFYRGSAAIQAHDLATTPNTGLMMQICGDAHLMNFGGFATPERNLVFDINDFDETHPGPWEWDVKRLAASITVAARHLGFKAEATDEMVFNAVERYRSSMADFAEMGELDLWYEKMTFDYILAHAKHEEGRKQIVKIMEKAQLRTHENVLPKMAEKINGKWTIRDNPPELFHPLGKSTLASAKDQANAAEVLKNLSGKFFKAYLSTISPSHRQLLSRFTIQDLAVKVVGVGSVGTRCLVLLMTDAQDQPLFLQIKQAVGSVLAPHVPPAAKSEIQHEGQRVVTGQRLMQSASDMFLGWTTGPAGNHFYFRQLRDMKVAVEIETFNAFVFGRYALLCCSILARAHARAGGMAQEISGYLGKGGQFAEAMVGYANNYANQVERDFAAFQSACRKGRLVARTEVDFRADFSV